MNDDRNISSSKCMSQIWKTLRSGSRHDQYISSGFRPKMQNATWSFELSLCSENGTLKESSLGCRSRFFCVMMEYTMLKHLRIAHMQFSFRDRQRYWNFGAEVGDVVASSARQHGRTASDLQTRFQKDSSQGTTSMSVKVMLNSLILQRQQHGSMNGLPLGCRHGKLQAGSSEGRLFMWMSSCMALLWRR